jgi:ribosome-associated translation inhibitor RaiA
MGGLVAEALTEQQLSAIVAQQIELAKSYDKTERATPRAKAIDYFLGDMDKYVQPEENRSKVVSRDVADTISRMLPGIMRVYLASDRMAVAEPNSTADMEYADQVTDGLNYVFFKDNDGEEIVYSVTWDALLVGNGVVKTYYDPTPVYTTSFHSGLTEDQVALLLSDEDVEVLAQTKEMETVETPEGPIELALYDLKIKRKKAEGSFVVDALPPEEFLKDGTSTKTEEAAFTCHWQRKTRSDLVQMGYDKAEVYAIPQAGVPDTAEAIARTFDTTAEANDASMELVDYYECFVRVDKDGDGEAELVRACYAGGAHGTLLHWEVWEDESPFDDIKCEPIPHRWVARSVADQTIDIQDVKTVLTRQLLNNTYWINNPQQFVAGKVNNPEALTDGSFGEPVFGDNGTVITPLAREYIGDKALAAIGYMDDVRQRRTGVSEQTMALDPEALQNQTAEAVRSGKDASYAQTEQVARNMAGGWKKVFNKLKNLMIKHQDYAREVVWNKKQVVIDPRFWNSDMKVSINVGLGTGSRERDLAMLGNVLQGQLMLADRFMGAGATEDAIDMLPKIIATMTKMAESAGIKNPEDYYPEYTEDKVAQLKELAAQPKPNPEIEKVKAQGEVQKELKSVDAQVSMQEAQLKAQGEVAKNQAELDADLATKEADRQNALLLAAQEQAHDLEKQNREIAFEMWKVEQANQMERDRMVNAQTIAAMKPQPEPQGRPAN